MLFTLSFSTDWSDKLLSEKKTRRKDRDWHGCLPNSRDGQSKYMFSILLHQSPNFPMLMVWTKVIWLIQNSNNPKTFHFHHKRSVQAHLPYIRWCAIFIINKSILKWRFFKHLCSISVGSIQSVHKNIFVSFSTLQNFTGAIKSKLTFFSHPSFPFSPFFSIPLLSRLN